VDPAPLLRAEAGLARLGGEFSARGLAALNRTPPANPRVGEPMEIANLSVPGRIAGASVCP